MSIVSHQQNAAWDAHYDENFPRSRPEPLKVGTLIFVVLADAFLTAPYTVKVVEARYFTAVGDDGRDIDLWLSDEGKTWRRDV